MKENNFVSVKRTFVELIEFSIHFIIILQDKENLNKLNKNRIYTYIHIFLDVYLQNFVAKDDRR